MPVYLHPGLARIFVLMLCTALLSGCATSPDRDPTDGIHDPFEAGNRKRHAINLSVDKTFLHPVARGYSRAVPDGIEESISNAAVNFGEPSVMVNSLLQGDLRGTGTAAYRFLINSTLGFAGLFDVAADFGVPHHDTDFGETLHVWGVGEGPYIEHFIIGPSTARRTAGRVVDLFINPLSYVLAEPPARYASPATRIARGLSQRERYSEIIDSILYDSADSYAQTRLIYLQNRRFKLGDTGQQGPAIDPFDLETEGF